MGDLSSCLMDDMSMSPMAANSIKALANYVAAFAGPGDEFSVIRLTNRSDEPHGDVESAVGRIAEYQPSPVPFDGLQAMEDLLSTVTNVRATIPGFRAPAQSASVHRHVAGVQHAGAAALGAAPRCGRNGS